MTSSAAPPRALLGALAAAASTLGLATPAFASEPERAGFDARPHPAAAAQPPGEPARDALRERLGRFGALSLDRRTGTLRSVGRLDGFLTGPSGRDGTAVALAYVREHADAFGLEASDLDGLRLVDRTFVDGIEHLAWEQRHRGIPVADAGLQAAVTGSGRLLNVTGPPAADLGVRSIEPGVGAADAYAAARASGGDASPGAGIVRREGGAEQLTRFGDGGRASLTLYRARAGYRLAWRVLAPVSSTAVYDVLVDARSAQPVRRANRVKFAVPAKVFRNNPATAAQEDEDFAPWLTSSTRLEGPNAHAFTDVHDVVGAKPTGGFGVTPEAGSDVARVNGEYDFPLAFAPHFSGDGCPDQLGPAPTSACTWDTQLTGAGSWAVNRQQSATQLFYFVNKFHDHLRDADGIEFVAGGFRNNPGQPRGNPNSTPPASASDPVLAQALDGADTASGRPDDEHVNGANFLTLPDGNPGLMQVYLWKPPYGGYDGSNDAALVFHEYTHGLTDRLVTDAAGFGALNSAQSGAMSEGWSDFYAIDYLVDEGLLPDGAGADLRFGGYFDNGAGTLVRRQPIDAQAGAFTYADFGESPGGPEVHDDGEIWGQTLWSLRTALIAAHGGTVGVTRARQYVTQALRLSPPEPSFLEMRNAILQAAGEDDDLLWAVFAARGMGYFAATDGGDDIDPVADSTDPADLTGTATVSGTVRDEEGQPVAAATVGVAGFDEGLGPQLSDVTGTDGTYSFDVLAPSTGEGTFGAVRARKAAFRGDREELVGVTDGDVELHDFELERDWSSGVPGAGTAKLWSFTGPDFTANGCGPGGLIDDAPGVVWGTQNVAGGQRIVVDLGAPIDVARIEIDPAPGCGDDESAALGSYQLLGATGPAGPFMMLQPDGTFTTIDNGSLSTAFNGPTAPRVRFVELRARAPQDATQGSGMQFIDVAELHVARQPNSVIGPTTDTTAASGVGTGSATMTGTVAAHDGDADVVFQYGRTTAYGATLSAGKVGAGTARAVAAKAGGLAPATTYHFRAVARSGGYDHPGADRTFRTAPAPPTPTPTPSATPTPVPVTPTRFDVGAKLTASRKGVFKVRVRFGNRAPAGSARLRVLAGRRRLAQGRFAVRPARTVTKTLTLNRTGRRTIKRGRSRRVTLELRLPDGKKVKKTIRLARRKR